MNLHFYTRQDILDLFNERKGFLFQHIHDMRQHLSIRRRRGVWRKAEMDAYRKQHDRREYMLDKQKEYRLRDYKERLLRGDRPVKWGKLWVQAAKEIGYVM